jgi:hypothetical protein
MQDDTDCIPIMNGCDRNGLIALLCIEKRISFVHQIENCREEKENDGDEIYRSEFGVPSPHALLYIMLCFPGLFRGICNSRQDRYFK